jgi:hypothetical protein
MGREHTEATLEPLRVCENVQKLSRRKTNLFDSGLEPGANRQDKQNEMYMLQYRSGHCASKVPPWHDRRKRPRRRARRSSDLSRESPTLC